MWGIEVYVHVFVMLALDGSKWSALHLSENKVGLWMEQL